MAIKSRSNKRSEQILLDKKEQKFNITYLVIGIIVGYIMIVATVITLLITIANFFFALNDRKIQQIEESRPGLEILSSSLVNDSSLVTVFMYDNKTERLDHALCDVEYAGFETLIYLTNTSESDIIIKNVYVDVVDYRKYQSVITLDYGGGQGSEEYQYYYGVISDNIGKKSLQYFGQSSDLSAAIEEYSPESNAFVKIKPGEQEAFLITLDTNKPGIYSYVLGIDYVACSKFENYETEVMKIGSITLSDAHRSIYVGPR